MSDTTFRSIIESRRIKNATRRITKIQALLNSGADINTRDPRGCTPLFLVCEAGNTLAPGTGKPRPHPARDERFKLAQFLLSQGADPNARDLFGSTPLHAVASNDDVELAGIILREGIGVDIDARDQNGETPLHVACAWGHLAVTRFLLEAGADARATDNTGTDPLELVTARPADPIWHRHREELLDLFRQYAPEAVMEKYVAGGLSL